MGLTKETSEYAILKLADCEKAFPAFWGPGPDWLPDHNWGGSGMIGLQDMLLQAVGQTLYLFPAWPREWDVDFKLWAPGRTTVIGILRGGVLVKLVVDPPERAADLVNLLDQANFTDLSNGD